MTISKFITIAALTAVGFTLAPRSALGQISITSSLSHNGRLVSENLQPGSTASVEWAPSAQGPWTNNWAGLESVAVDSNGRIQVGVPMFYRVRGIQAPSLGKATFTKWVSAFPNQPGRIADMTGVVGGDVGDGKFTGEVLLYSPDPALSHFVAFYHFAGPQHSFTALVDVWQTGAVAGSKAMFIGAITDGWMKGHAVEGEFTQIAIDHDGGDGFQGSVDIKSHTTPPSADQTTFTKWVSAFPNQPGRIADMTGVVGGVVGEGKFTGEVLLYNPDSALSHFVAFYHFTGPQHSFTALVDVWQTGAVTGSKATFVGVVSDGWMKGRAVEGEFTQIAIDHDGGAGFQGTVNFK